MLGQYQGPAIDWENIQNPAPPQKNQELKEKYNIRVVGVFWGCGRTRSESFFGPVLLDFRPVRGPHGSECVRTLGVAWLRSEDGKDLIRKMLKFQPFDRATASQAEAQTVTDLGNTGPLT